MQPTERSYVFWLNKAYFNCCGLEQLGVPLTVPRNRRKRDKALIAVLLPATIFLWIVGWGLYWISRQKESPKPQSPSPKDEDHVHLMPIIFEDPIEIRS
jgi:hypothetical protein